MNLILFGFKRCGKTYFGKLLAEQLQMHFVDVDTLIEKLYAEENQNNLTCAEIYKAHGEKLFRHLEHKAIQFLEGCNNTVIALGGGAILDPNNQILLKKIGQLVYLQLDKKTLKQRILSGKIPSYLDPLHPEDSFEDMYQKRKSLYEKIPAAHVSLNGKTDAQILEELRNVLQKGSKEYGE